MVSGRDLIQSLKLDTGAAVTGSSLNWTCFCSADLAVSRVFYDSFLGRGAINGLLLNGEESGSAGRDLATVPTSRTSTGMAWLPQSFGTSSWETLLSNPGTGQQILVTGHEDSTPAIPNSVGKVCLYLGTKTNSRSDIDKAGLTDGTQYAVVVNGVGRESRTKVLSSSSPLSRAPLDLVRLPGERADSATKMVSGPPTARTMLTLPQPTDSTAMTG